MIVEGEKTSSFTVYSNQFLKSQTQFIDMNITQIYIHMSCINLYSHNSLPEQVQFL